MDKKQLEDLIVRPTLRDIRQGLSEPSVLAVMMIVAHESRRGEFIKQKGTGPALGLIQMEPRTHASTWRYGDSIWDNARSLGIISNSQYIISEHPKANRLIYDLRYNVFMARQRLFMKRELLPNFGNSFKQIDAMSRYLKKHWNSVSGAAEDDSYATDYWLWKD